ncbi:MAG TPA: hypothetical protein VMM18_10315 [Gemmatimonadaceae bacterium]|nr:hypothetical protein [Gemmatimonadaceae bacterium]
MTSAEFAATYRVLRRISHEGVRSYTAQHVATQRPVMVHFLDGMSEPERGSLLARLGRLEPPDRARVYERLEVDGGPVVVTQILSGFASLPTWLAGRIEDGAETEAANGPAVLADRGIERTAVRDAAETPAAAVTPRHSPPPASPLDASPAGGSSVPGEFTRLFSSPSAPPEQRPEVSPRMSSAQAPTPVEGNRGGGSGHGAVPRESSIGSGHGAQSREQSGGAGGGFTEIFGAPPMASGTGAHRSPSPPLSRPSPVATPVTAPMTPVQRAPVEPNRAPPLQAPPIVEAGEFTRMFRPAAAPSQPPLSATPFTPPRGSPPPGAFPPGGGMPMSGSATGALKARPFVPPGSNTTPSPAPSPIVSPTEFPPPLPPEFLNRTDAAGGQGLAGSPPFSAPQPAAPPAAPPVPASRAPLAAGPSEFTRIIAAPVSSSAAGSPATAATASPAVAPPPTGAAPASAPAPAPSSGSGSAAPATDASAKTAGGGASPAPNWTVYIPLLLVLNVIAIVAMGLIIYFAVKN